jgi:hypothetical protein
MFGVLIVVLSPDGITDLGFSTRKCQILLPPLFDHLIGDREQFIWNSEAEGFSRLKIDD